MRIDELIRQLKESAQRATPGPWRFDCGKGEIESEDEKHYMIDVARRPDFMDRIEHCKRFNLGPDTPTFPAHPDDDCMFIALANPKNILALCDYIERLDSNLQYLTGKIGEK